MRKKEKMKKSIKEELKQKRDQKTRLVNYNGNEIVVDYLNEELIKIVKYGVYKVTYFTSIPSVTLVNIGIVHSDRTGGILSRIMCHINNNKENSKKDTTLKNILNSELCKYITKIQVEILYNGNHIKDNKKFVLETLEGQFCEEHRKNNFAIMNKYQYKGNEINNVWITNPILDKIING